MDMLLISDPQDFAQSNPDFFRLMKATTSIRDRAEIIWVFTDPDCEIPTSIQGFVSTRDRVFFKPDTDARLETLPNPHLQQTCTEYIADCQPNRVFVSGTTLFGCVEGAYTDIQEIGIAASIIVDFTDIDNLPQDEYEEGLEYVAGRLDLAKRSDRKTALLRNFPDSYQSSTQLFSALGITPSSGQDLSSGPE